VAARVERIDQVRSIEIPYRGPVVTENQLSSWVESSEPVALKRRTDTMQIPDYRCHVSLVFADVVHGDLVDPNLGAGGVEGPMTRYARTRSFRHLTESVRKSRAAAVDLIRSFYADLKHETDAPSDLPGPVEELQTQIVSLRRAGQTPRAIAKTLGVDEETVKLALHTVAAAAK
jgi:hypothetical protein